MIGLSAGLGMWVLGTTGLVEGAERYALLFGVWTAFVEVIPYIGPWLSAVPPAIYALAVDPVGFIWVALLFVFIYQVEGHIVVPNVMANALRLHPLLVIFGLLAGASCTGSPACSSRFRRWPPLGRSGSSSASASSSSRGTAMSRARSRAPSHRRHRPTSQRGALRLAAL